MILNTKTSQSEIQSTNADLILRGSILPFSLITLLFFVWGMSNNLTDILVQQFRKSFALTQLEAQLVQTAVFAGYFLMALPAARFMGRFGYRAGILLGLSLFGTGTLLFWPAAVIGHYTPFLCALFLVGCGSATLETAANPLVAEFGAAETAERRLNFSQSFNPLGSIAGVLIGTFFIFSGVEMSHVITAAAAHAEIMRVVPTYVGLGVVVLVLALVIARIRFPAFVTARLPQGETTRFRDLLPCNGLWWAVIAQFFYVGAQVATWSAFIPYVRQYTALSERASGLMLTGNLIALALGRVVSTGLMRRVRPVRLLATYAVVNIILLGGAILRPGLTGAWLIVSTSFFMSILFPTIFALGIRGLGTRTKLGGSVIVMSVIGGAVLPPLLGWIASRTGSLALGYLVPLVAYCGVFAYGLREALQFKNISQERQ